MKTKWLSCLKLTLLSFCKSALRDHRVDSFIAGIYEREYNYGSAMAKDTMTIRRISEVTDLFEIERRVVRDSVQDEEATAELSRTEKWIAAYHAPTHQLVQGVSHKICSFAPERDVLFFENKKYWKTGILAYDPTVW